MTHFIEALHLPFLDLHTSIFPDKLTLPCSPYMARSSDPRVNSLRLEYERELPGTKYMARNIALHLKYSPDNDAAISHGLGGLPHPRRRRARGVPKSVVLSYLVELDIQRPRQPSPPMIHDVADSLDDIKVLAEKITVLLGARCPTRFHGSLGSM
ncbi:hypothetical protein CPB85DRAFT_295628 [Mucidula mucida]|nr:hypothetical protein CPB85DRAFT_295628 [Mucidula mucida]